MEAEKAVCGLERRSMPLDATGGVIQESRALGVVGSFSQCVNHHSRCVVGGGGGRRQRGGLAPRDEVVG